MSFPATDRSTHPLPRLAVGIATRGRPQILAAMLAVLLDQTRRPDRLLICYTTQGDIENLDYPSWVEFLTGGTGLCRQRNAILDRVADCDFLLFLDDDFLCAPTYVAATLAAFAGDPTIVVTTGRLLADGARGPGLSVPHARALLAAECGDRRMPPQAPTFNGYGCNMAIRLAAVRALSLRFDERLPLYAWFEDVDFSRRLGRHGQVVQIDAARGVHLGVKLSRTSGVPLGYAQVVNPLYLFRKGSVPLGFALRSAGRHCLINLVRAVRPEQHVDRRGRLAGNLLALRDLLLFRARARADPGVGRRRSADDR